MSSFIMPYYMENEEWYYYDEIKKKYILTEKAPLKAIHSYKRFDWEYKISELYSMGIIADDLEDTLYNLGEILIYLEDYYSKEDILNILNKFCSIKYLDSWIFDCVKNYYESGEILLENIYNFTVGIYSLKCDIENRDKLGVNVIDEKIENILKIRIDDLEISCRALNCLRNNKINTVKELLSLSQGALRKFKNLGNVTLKEIMYKQYELKSEIYKISGKENYNPNNKITLLTDISDLNLTARSTNCLLANNIKYIKDLIKMNQDELIKMDKIGEKCLKEISNKINEILDIIETDTIEVNNLNDDIDKIELTQNTDKENDNLETEKFDFLNFYDRFK